MLPIIPAATPASIYSLIASSLVNDNPAWARSITCCPISVGTSAAAPLTDPLPILVNIPPVFIAGVAKNPPTNKRSTIPSAAACGIADKNAAPSLTSVLIPCSIASFCR